MNKYQIIKRDGKYIPGMLIPYFWTWYIGPGFFTLENAKSELVNRISESKAASERNKTEVVFEMESEY